MKNEKILLPNGCHCSTPKICPRSAYGKKASTAKDWYIQYRFYDPSNTGDDGKIIPHQEVFKGMNHCKNVTDRRSVCKDLIDNELTRLKKGFNPFTRQTLNEPERFYDIDPSTPFIKALRLAHKKLTGVPGTLTDIKSVITGVEKAAIQLGVSEIPINAVTRKYINAILERCKLINKRFTANRHNKYRAYLMKLFKQLIRMEATEINPMYDIDEQKTTKKMRRTLTREERTLINETLFRDHYYFWRLLQIFFHSGSRETEIMKVQAKHVDLAGQRCLYTVLKGTEIREVYRPIKDVILSLWKEVLQECKPGDFLFSEGMVPGSRGIRADQITRRWYRYVKAPVKKGGLGIDADFYSVKHLNTTETIDILGELDAAKQNSHTTPIITIANYDTKKEQRQHDRLVKVVNSFS